MESFPSSFRGASEASEPGIHNHDREYGFRACRLRSATADRRRILRCAIAHRGMTKDKTRKETKGGATMKLTQQQIDDFNREGWLFLPELFNAEEVSLLAHEAERI